MESCCIYISVLWVPSRTVVQCYYFVFHPHASAWWAPSSRFYAGLAGFAETCIGPILRVLQSTPNIILPCASPCNSYSHNHAISCDELHSLPCFSNNEATTSSSIVVDTNHVE